MLKLFFYMILAAISVTDMKEHRIPDWLTGMILLLGMADLLISGSEILLVERAIGFVCTPLLLVLCNFIRSGAFGGGDLKLLAACGWYLGWKLAFVGLAASFICCGIYCVAGLALSKISRKTILAYGPFISLGMAIAALFGKHIIIWYIS